MLLYPIVDIIITYLRHDNYELSVRSRKAKGKTKSTAILSW